MEGGERLSDPRGSIFAEAMKFAHCKASSQAKKFMGPAEPPSKKRKTSAAEDWVNDAVEFAQKKLDEAKKPGKIKQGEKMRAQPLCNLMIERARRCVCERKATFLHERISICCFCGVSEGAAKKALAKALAQAKNESDLNLSAHGSVTETSSAKVWAATAAFIDNNMSA